MKIAVSALALVLPVVAAHEWSTDQLPTVGKKIQRHLDCGSDTTYDCNVPQRNVSRVCEEYNAAYDSLNCTCTELGEKDTEVKCDPSCTNGECSSPFAFHFLLDLRYVKYQVKTCEVTIRELLSLKTCVTVKAANLDNITKVDSCSVSVNDKDCNSCSVCGGGQSVKFQCCNVLNDTLQSKCVDVKGGGSLIASLDPLPTKEADRGRCNANTDSTGGGSSASVHFAHAIFFTAIPLVVTWVSQLA